MNHPDDDGGIFNGLTIGSNAILSLLIFGAVFIALRSRRDVLAGALLGLELFRPHLLVCPPLLALED